ncbi:hypothetical protein [Motiliproteus sp. SC1-56]|uniref:hypothetical protein n=1 Tax=Motiliproteus sp. SC1-56 TaxID=2799565 RepID=UPI001A8C5CBC|nr:hypothetical protein [Motiliproteus sp. SC1-56]
MLPKPLYEALPYGIFALGSLCWLLSERPLVVVLGIVLYCLGALLWVWRTHYRRRDRVRANLVDKVRSQRLKPRFRHWVWPRALYEAMPFAYIAAGFVLATLLSRDATSGSATLSSSLLLMATLLLLLSGVTVLVLRGRHRLAMASS